MKDTATVRVVSKVHGVFDILIDKEDLEFVNRYTWSVAMRKGAVYFCTTDPSNPKRQVLLHRLLKGNPVGKVVDHRDPNNTLDNRKSRLRVANHRLNAANMRSHRDSSSQFKGIFWSKQKNKWQSAIFVEGRRKHLGFSDDEEQAARLYDAAALENHGDFAHLNFPKEA